MSDGTAEKRVAVNLAKSKTSTLDTNPYFDTGAKKGRKLPEWLDHFNSRDLKILFKCSMAAWIYTLFLLINPTLKVIGQATFFGVLVLFIVPPSGVIFIGILAGVTIILGACLGWAWGTITMKAALAARPAADLQAQYARLQQTNTRNTTNAQAASGQSTYTQIAIYNGAMLDTRVSVTYFCMIGLFIYLVARLRLAAPKLTLIQIFAMIISDIYLTVAPLIPTFQGTIPRTLILPAGIAVGVSFVCNLLFFPRSTSHLVLDGMQDMLKPMDIFFEACLLNFKQPDQHMSLLYLKATKSRVIRAFKAVEANFGFLALDASVGRWGTDDVRALHPPLRRVLIMFVSLAQVQINRREHRLRDEALEELAEFVDLEQMRKNERVDLQHLHKIYDFSQRSKHPESESLMLSSLRALGNAGEDLIPLSIEALAAVNASMRLSNTRRWFGRLTPQQCEESYQRHNAVLDNLRRHKNAFPGRMAKELWDSHKHMFDADGKLIMQHKSGVAPPMGGVMLSLVLEHRIQYFIEALESLLAAVVELERTRTKVRVWLPGNLQNLLPWALKKDISPNTMSGGGGTMSSSSDDDEILSAKQSEQASKKKEKKTKKDKKAKVDLDEAESAAGQLHRMKVRGVKRRKAGGRLLLGIAHWFSSTEGMYALRILIVTIALGVPAVVPASAGFYYREKGLWGMIMAQTALLPYTADFIASFFLRMAGTLIGAVLGLAMWYIGAGNGPGNPYGMAAIAAPLIIFFMWLRLFTNPAFMQGILLTVVTMYLVMAYSWVDTHIPSYGNPGVGVSVFWRRMLLVIIGFAAAAIVTFFPRPPSASKHHRRLLSESLQTVKNQYALFVLNCRQLMPDLKETCERVAIDASDILIEIEPQITLLKLEFSTSNFDAESLSKICNLCLSLNQSITQLLIYATSLPEESKNRLLRVTGTTDEAHVADIMAVITVIQQSLKTGDPLPAILPGPLIVRALGTAGHRMQGDEHIVRLSEERLGEEDTRLYCSAMSAAVQFLSTIDELVLVVKNAVGETTWVDIEGTEFGHVPTRAG